MTKADDTLELEDIQGIIVRGYAHMSHACYVLYHIPPGKEVGARQWLSGIADRVCHGKGRPEKNSLNIALTHAGLKSLGLDGKALETFSREFIEGMNWKHRSRILGDTGQSSPENWMWGGTRPGSKDVHVLLMLFSTEQADLDALYAEHLEKSSEYGIEELRRLDTQLPPKAKEHFGFHDGISQPVIKGLPKEKQGGPAENIIAAGEFILGYTNEYGRYPSSPAVEASYDSRNMLPAAQGAPGARDLGRNGSYLVFRQLSQDVHGFWNFMNTTTMRDGAEEPHERVRLASKMVGRWPSGAPLVEAPESDNAELYESDNFNYSGDPHGMRCPMASHIRRTNPRDTMVPDPKESIMVARRHRILRRARSYGRPVAESMDPADILATPPNDEERGLHFICLNTDIGRQFEFVQQTWVNSPKFEGLYEDVDPLLGNHDGNPAGGTFTMPCFPVRKRVGNIPSFVHTRGGAYFFLPGIRALRYLASLPS